MRIAICDDQEIYRNDVQTKCQEILSDNRITYKFFSSGEELLSSDEQWDLLFLDIEMSGVDGIFVKDSLAQKQSETKIIFLTSHKERMIEAFGANVIGFLVKPVQKDRLEDLLRKISIYLRREVVEWFESGKQYAVAVEDIRYIEAQDKYTYVVWKAGKCLVRRSVKEWENILPAIDFCKVNRSYLINMDLFNMSISDIELEKGKIIKISRTNRKAIEEKYKRYLRKQMEKM